MRLFIEVDVRRLFILQNNQLREDEIIGCFIHNLLEEHQILDPHTNEVLGYITLSDESMTWNVRVD